MSWSPHHTPDLTEAWESAGPPLTDWCRAGQAAILWGTKGRGWCQRKTSSSGGVAADGQPSWRKKKKRPVYFCPKVTVLPSLPHVIFIQVCFFDFQDREQKKVCSFKKRFIPHTVALSRVCQVWDPTHRIAQSVSFIVTPVGVPLVACFFSFVQLNANLPNASLLILTAHASCIVEEPIIHSTGVINIWI